MPVTTLQGPLVLPSAVLRTFRRRLTNLSSRNRSLLLTSLPAGQFLDLHETDFLLNKPSFSLIADLIGRKAAVTLSDVLDARQERSNEVSRKLRRIDRTARFIEEERGTADLYVGWPFVRGKFLDGTVVHGPLLFFPVQIEQPGKSWKLARRGDETAFLNPTLALAYSQFNQVKLPDEVVEKTVDDFDKDPLAFRTQLYEWLKTTPLELNFNSDLFTDTLQFFDKQTAKSLDQLERTGELKLVPEAVLGIFPQAGSFLVPDYDEMIEKGMEGGEEDGPPLREEREERDEGGPPLRDEMDEFPHPLSPLSLSPLSSPTSPSSSASLPERFIHTPLPLDASQEAAVRAVKAGHSLVVQGPPGTGKSQLIANLMADAAASGKRVLLVCQKRAALDVVQERLGQVGMSPFMALVHDFQDDRRALYAQIAGQIDQIDAYRKVNNSLNAVLLERDFEVESRRIDEAVMELQAFKDALFDTGECGLSAKELYLTSTSESADAPGLVILNDIYSQFKFLNVDNFVRRLSDFAAYQQRLPATHPWANRVPFSTFAGNDLTAADQTIREWRQTTETTNAQIIALLNNLLLLPELLDWQAHDRKLTALLSLLDVPDGALLWNAVLYLRQSPTHPALSISETRFDELASEWNEIRLVPGPEVSLQPLELAAFEGLLTDALLARPSWIRWNWWQMTNPGKVQLLQVLAANKLTLREADLQTLAVKVEKSIALDIVRLEAKPLLAGLDLPESPDSLRLLRRARHLAERFADLAILHRLPASVWNTHTHFTSVASTLLNTATSVQQQWLTAQTYLVPKQLDRAWSAALYSLELRKTLRTDFDLLVEADRLAGTFSEPERTLIERLNRHEPLTWTTAFQNALRLAWLNHIEQKYPVLRSVSSLKMGQTEQSLQQSVLQKQELSRAVLLVKLRDQTYRNLTLNRLNNIVTYRELAHQTTKKRSVWPIRKLMESFADEVFRLVPCWLASPESVSAMFPLRDDLFDLVIFDEASQCFAENGIPAMMRGKQVVVTGDNQQLRPSDLYRTRLDESDADDEIPAALEVESLLELAAQQLPQVLLTEHYRSRSLDLITFSNEHFYRNRLSLLPHFGEINHHEPAIRYVHAAGIWQQNTNLVEANAVVQLIGQLATELPGRSIGVVTFNYPQQQLIQDLLEGSQPVKGEILPESTMLGIPHLGGKGLFVKNIENVQGDERDIIIFSVGYAPDERGRLAMQFGSLNAAGGGNRLNVAVTRARERVYVITSLWPDQLAVADAANEGPRLLKAYLAYALTVSQGHFHPIPILNMALPGGSLLRDKLATQHPDWQPELPFADLTVKEDNGYKSLILTDDDAYFQQTTKQAHAYLPIALQNRGWPFERFWSRTFWQQNQ